MDRSDEKEEKLSECTIPGPVAFEFLKETVLGRVKHEEDAIQIYMEWQAKDEHVVHLEKITNERVFGRELSAWDVHTDRNRWWVITNPTNLYSQELFPSLDYTLSFHIGVTARMMAAESKLTSDGNSERFVSAWRRWEQAAEALDKADEAEEFQAVGMRCRACLLAFIKEINKEEMCQPGQVLPKSADFVNWMEIIASTVASGESSKEIRGHLKSTAKSTWQLVNWLTHATNAVRFDGQMALDATQSTLVAFSMAIVRYEQGLVDRCPQCQSYKLASIYQPALEIEPPYIVLCQSCGWENYRKE